MSLVSMRQLLDHAAENAYGIPAFNVNNLEQVTAIMEAASEAKASGTRPSGTAVSCMASDGVAPKANGTA